MSDAPAYKFKDFYDRQVAFLANNDTEGLITNNYNTDAELVSFQNHIVGDAALREYFKGYVAGLGYIKLLSTDKYTETDNALFFEATVETAGGTARVYDVMVMRGGKIQQHFTGLLGFTPKGS